MLVLFLARWSPPAQRGCDRTECCASSKAVEREGEGTGTGVERCTGLSPSFPSLLTVDPASRRHLPPLPPRLLLSSTNDSSSPASSSFYPPMSIIRHFVTGEHPSHSSPKFNRRPSGQPLLPHSFDNGKTPSNRNRSRKATAVKLLTVVVVLYWTGKAALWAAGVTGNGEKKAAVRELRRDSCEARGLVTATTDESHRAVIRLRPAPSNEPRARNPDNTILHFSLHPSLSDALPRLFDGSSSPSAFPSSCVTPYVQQLPLTPRLEASPFEPELFFSISTTPSRAVTTAPIWSTFMTAPSPSSSDLDFASGRPRIPKAPGCLITDAQNKGDSKGAAMAHAEFRRQGISCVFKDSTRAGERYEMRVLSLVRDAWLESERRRWQRGERMVEWFVFQDDDTCTSLSFLSSLRKVELTFLLHLLSLFHRVERPSDAPSDARRPFAQPRPLPRSVQRN